MSAEHLEWCRTRALAILDEGANSAAVQAAVDSMTSDLSKHPDTRGLLDGGITSCATPGWELEVLERLAGFNGPHDGTLRTPDQVREWIEGFR